MSDSTYQQKRQLINSVFTPSSPILSKDLFYGREYQISRITTAIDDPGKHIVLYGERGVGKTSLANLVEMMANKLVSKITCESDDNYSALWERALQKIQVPLQQTETPDTTKDEIPVWEKFADDSGIITSPTLVEGLASIDFPIIFIFDEFDRVTEDDVKKKFSDTIKVLSDNSSHITVMLVGVADNVLELIDAHPSVQRCTTQVPLPLMKAEEVGKIIDNGFQMLDMHITSQLRTGIINLSQGFPHYSHSLCKHSAIAAINVAQHTKISPDSLECEANLLVVAVNDAVSDTFETIKETYRKAIASSKAVSRFPSVLIAAAIAPVDEYNMFRQVDLVEPMSRLEGKKVSPQSYAYHLSKLCDEERGFILKRSGTKNNFKYCFRDPMVRAFVLLKAYQEKNPELQSFLLAYEDS